MSGIETTLTCPVPGCKKAWVGKGPRQGFVVAAANRHINHHKVTAELEVAKVRLGVANIVPFADQFREALYKGTKVATTRSHWIGKVGERFAVMGNPRVEWSTKDPAAAKPWLSDDMVFEITERKRLALGEVAELHFAEEGFDSPGGFIQIWDRLHPYIRFQRLEKKCFHRFKRVA